jgi:hypothetical protein
MHGLLNVNLQLDLHDQSQWEDSCYKLREYEVISSQPMGPNTKNSFIYQAKLCRCLLPPVYLKTEPVSETMVNFYIFNYWMKYLAQELNGTKYVCLLHQGLESRPLVALQPLGLLYTLFSRSSHCRCQMSPRPTQRERSKWREGEL